LQAETTQVPAEHIALAAFGGAGQSALVQQLADGMQAVPHVL
jgi:hypothetical protein